jgi:hypothetical protein
MYVGTWITVRRTRRRQDRSVPGSALVCARLSDTDAQLPPQPRRRRDQGQRRRRPSWATGVGSTFARTPQGASDADALSTRA